LLGPLSAVLLAGLSGCQLDRSEGLLMAAGSYGDIAVVLSDDDLRPLADRFIASLNVPVTFVIKEEAPYNIDVFGPDKWKLCRAYRNIIFLLRLGDGGPVQKEVKRRVAEALWQRAAEGGTGLVQVHDPYARYQYAVITLANDRNLLASYLNRSVEEIRDLLEVDIRKRYRRGWRQDGIDPQRAARYWQALGFTVQVPAQYRDNQVEPGGFPAIEWIQAGPSRGLTVAWRKSTQPSQDVLNQDLLLAWRRELGAAVHSEELVDVSLLWRADSLAGQSCPKLTGAWAATDFEGGGPFWSYFLADPQGKRIFCLDLLVYAPGQDKMRYFRELLAIAETFSLTQNKPE
jgi:hypothetical protein